MDLIERRLAEIKRLTEQTRPSARPIDTEREVQRMMRGIKTLGESLDGLPPAALRKLLEEMIVRLEANMETREVQLDLRIAGTNAINEKEGGNLGLDGQLLWQLANQTQAEITAKIDCAWVEPEKCFECYRRNAA